MENKPLITIVTPSFNQGQFIEETILSVLNQTYKNIQYIIADGGSTDQTMDVVNKYKDKIDIIINEKDDGQTDAINKGFKLAKGELVGWINSDDILYEDCIGRIVELYNNKPDGSIFCFSKLNHIDILGNLIKTVCKIFKDRDYLINKSCYVIQQGSFYPLIIVKKINYLDKSLNYCMDLDLWIRLLEYGRIYSIQGNPGAEFRVWENTKTSSMIIPFIEEVIKLLRYYKVSKFSLQIYKFQWYILRRKIKLFLFSKK